MYRYGQIDSDATLDICDFLRSTNSCCQHGNGPSGSG